MPRVPFRAYGHENVLGNHRTTVELTSEDFLTLQGSCIIGVRSELTLNMLDDEIKSLVRSEKTTIVLRLSVGDLFDEIRGHGSSGLTYTDNTSMVARTSTYQCGRTLMIQADKAAAGINRELISEMQKPETTIDCELVFISE